MFRLKSGGQMLTKRFKFYMFSSHLIYLVDQSRCCERGSLHYVYFMCIVCMCVYTCSSCLFHTHCVNDRWFGICRNSRLTVKKWRSGCAALDCRISSKGWASGPSATLSTTLLKQCVLTVKLDQKSATSWTVPKVHAPTGLHQLEASCHADSFPARYAVWV